MSYKIFTDSTCDVKKEDLDAWGVGYFNLVFYFSDEENVLYSDMDMPAVQFYNEMRKGRISKTAGTNIQVIREAFESSLKKGEDILYLGFSSALSTTYNSGVIAARELSEDYPDRKIYCIDTLSQSAGQALLLKLAADRKREGFGIDEVREYIEERKLHIAHWFTVDDLQYLRRGGRLSPASAVLATVLNIKPVLHTDNNGMLVATEKVRGRKQAIRRLIDIYGESAEHPGKGPVFFCHSDSPEDMKFMGELLKAEYGVEPDHICDVGPVIGSHIGPGTVALFYEAKER